MGALIGDGTGLTFLIKVVVIATLVLDFVYFIVSFDKILDMNWKERGIGCLIVTVGVPVVIASITLILWAIAWFLSIPNFFPGR